MIIKRCKKCGKEFRADRNRTIYCGLPCFYLNRLSGEKSANWKGGKGFAQRKREYRKKFPLKETAHQAVKYGLKTGRIKKSPCADCGNKKVEAHHNDYTKPLEIVWYCRRHHVVAHKT